MYGGRLPEKLFCWRANNCIVDILNMEDGMGPDKKSLKGAANNSRSTRLPSSSVIKKPEVKQILGIPDLPPPRQPQKPDRHFDTLREAMANHEQLKSVLFYFESKLGHLLPPRKQPLSPPQQSLLPPALDEPSKPAHQTTPSSVLTGNINDLEKKVKRSKKRNKRLFR